MVPQTFLGFLTALQMGPGSCPGCVGDGMGWGMGGWTGFWLVWLLLGLGLIALVAVLVVFVTRRESAASADSAMDELRARYARGEIDDDEFERRRAQLAGTE